MSKKCKVFVSVPSTVNEVEISINFKSNLSKKRKARISGKEEVEDRILDLAMRYPHVFAKLASPSKKKNNLKKIIMNLPSQKFASTPPMMNEVQITLSLSSNPTSDPLQFRQDRQEKIENYFSQLRYSSQHNREGWIQPKGQKV